LTRLLLPLPNGATARMVPLALLVIKRELCVQMSFVGCFELSQPLRGSVMMTGRPHYRGLIDTKL
jgi:hypothetical protein